MKQIENGRTSYYLADILRDNKPSFFERYNLFTQQEKAYRDICTCRIVD